VVICLERGADLHMAQLMPLPLTVSCFSKIHIGFTFFVPAHPGSPERRAVKRARVCVSDDGTILQVNNSYREESLALFAVLFRISATLSCPMKLQKYPLDTQRCPLMFESCELCRCQAYCNIGRNFTARRYASAVIARPCVCPLGIHKNIG